MRRALAPAGLLVALSLGVAGPAAAQGLGEPEVTGLSFEGNERFDDSELSSAIVTQQTHCRTFLFKFPFPFCPLTDWGFAHSRAWLEPAELQLDVLRLQLFYRERGYRDAVVDTVVHREDDKVRIRFLIHENRPTLVDSVDVQGGAEVIEPGRVRDLVGIRPGDPLDLVALRAGEGRVTDRLRRDGYVRAAVLHSYFVPTDTAEATTLTLRVVPGPRVRVGRIDVQGAGAVGEDVVRGLLEFGSGDWLDENAILESQRRLYELEALRWANITTSRRPGTDTLVDVTVQVAAAPKRSIVAGVGVETNECVSGQVQFTNRNFLGAARVLRLQTRVSNVFAGQLNGNFPCNGVGTDTIYQQLNYQLEAGFEQPVFSSGRNRLRARVFTERQTVPNLYVRTSTGGEVGFNRRLASRMGLTFAYRPELTSFDERSADIYFCVNFGLCSPEDIAVLSQKRWLAPVSALWSVNRTDNVLSATRGWYASVSAENAGQLTGSEYAYVRGVVDAAAFRRILGGPVLAAHVRFGAVDPTGDVFGSQGSTEQVVHPQKRFFAGGPQSVRGYGLNLLGPTILVISEADDCGGRDLSDEELQQCALELQSTPGRYDERAVGGNAAAEGSVELRFPLGDRWTVVGFLDAGQVWQSLSTRRPIVATPGVGFRFRSPVGPLRVDFGYNPSGVSRKSVVAVRETGEIVELPEQVRYDPFTYDNPGFLKEFVRRIQLQFSIGEAF